MGYGRCSVREASWRLGLSTRVQVRNRKKLLAQTFIDEANCRGYTKYRTGPGAYAVKRVTANGFYATISPMINLRRSIYSYDLRGGVGHPLYDEIMSTTCADWQYFLGTPISSRIGLDDNGDLDSSFWGLDGYEYQDQKVASCLDRFFLAFEPWSIHCSEWRLLLEMEMASKTDAFSRYSVPVLAKILDEFDTAVAWFKKLENSGWRDFRWDEYTQFFRALEDLSFDSLRHASCLPRRKL